jgi:oligo-1,6-glucosidase
MSVSPFTGTDTMRGTPYCYYGDELGMSNIRFDRIGDYRDIATINKFKHLVMEGADTTSFLQEQKRTSRDNGRTSFQWDNSPNAGFTTGTPWIRVHRDYPSVNAAAQEKDPGSVLNYFRKAVQLRKANPVLVYGKYTLLDKDNADVYAYTRELDGRRLLVLLNFKGKNSSVKTDIDLSKAKPLLDNYSTSSGDGYLRPFEAVVYEL